MKLLRSRILAQATSTIFTQVVCNKIERLPPHLQTLANKYRSAIAEVLGVPPEAIREDIVVKWVKDWAEAYVKPEYRQVVRAKLYGNYITVKKKTVHY